MPDTNHTQSMSLWRAYRKGLENIKNKLPIEDNGGIPYQTFEMEMNKLIGRDKPIDQILNDLVDNFGAREV